jgi:hypothetical protein
MSRVTLHRIEKGEPSVTMGAWCNALAALGLALQARSAAEMQADSQGTPARPHRLDSGTGGAGRLPATARAGLAGARHRHAHAHRGAGHLRTQRTASGLQAMSATNRPAAGVAAGPVAQPCSTARPCSLNAPTTSALRMCWVRWTAPRCASMAACLAAAPALRCAMGEYRESVDIDFLVSDAAGYRELRQLLTGPRGWPHHPPARTAPGGAARDTGRPVRHSHPGADGRAGHQIGNRARGPHCVGAPGPMTRCAA